VQSNVNHYCAGLIQYTTYSAAADVAGTDFYDSLFKTGNEIKKSFWNRKLAGTQRISESRVCLKSDFLIEVRLW
jgi:hypothetical protein